MSPSIGVRAAALALIALVAQTHRPTPVNAQEPTAVEPGDGTLDPARLVPFVAEYDQMGFPFRVRVQRTTAVERPIVSVQMIMDGPHGIGIDHVGLHADDLTFAYRRFGFGAFRDEYVEVVAEGDSLRIRRLSRSAEDAVPDATAVGGGPTLDGTVLYWLLGTLPLRVGEAWTFPTWHLNADAAAVDRTPPLRATGVERMVLEDGTAFDAWTVEVESGSGALRMWVTDRPPYLLRQDMTGPDGELTPVVVATRLVDGGG